MESGEIMYEKVYVSPRPPPTMSFKDNWTKELDWEVAGSSKHLTNPTSDQEWRDLRVDKSPPRRLRKISSLVTKTSSTQQERGDPWWIEIHTKLRAWWCQKKIEEEDQTRTERPVGGQESTEVEELDTDFRSTRNVTCSSPSNNCPHKSSTTTESKRAVKQLIRYLKGTQHTCLRLETARNCSNRFAGTRWP